MALGIFLESPSLKQSSGAYEYSDKYIDELLNSNSAIHEVYTPRRKLVGKVES